jgi:hypothetical protein
MLTPYYNEVQQLLDDGTTQTIYSSDTNLPTPSEVRNRWCFGLPLNKEDGGVMSDEDIMQFLRSAVSQVERELGIYLKPTVIMTNPDERGLEEGVDFDVAEPAYDYSARAYQQYGFLQLRERPVQEIRSFKMILPNGNLIIDFTRDENTRKWIKLYKEAGQLNIVPYAGDPSIFMQMGGSSSGYPFMTGRINSNLPQMFYVDYVAGYKLHGIPHDIRNAVAKIAAIDVLGIAGDATLAGVASQSTSVDGFSESVSTTASATSATYNAHILQYQKEVDALFSAKKGAARSAERGITFVGL